MRTLVLAALAALLFDATGSSAAPFSSQPASNPATKVPIPVSGASIDQAQANTTTTATQNVKDVDEPIRHPYQQTEFTNACTIQGDCAIVFPAITNPRVLIQHVSCVFALADSGAPFIVYASISAGGEFPDYVTATSSGGNNGVNYTDWTINSDVYLFVNKGQSIRIDVFSEGQPVAGLQCTAAGYFEG